MTRAIFVPVGDHTPPRSGKAQLVIVGHPGASANDVCADVLEGLARDVGYPRFYKQSYMDDNGHDTCSCFYIDISVRKGRRYKRKKK